MEAKRLGLSTISTALDKFSTTFVKNAFKPLASLASPLTTGTTSSQAQDLVRCSVVDKDLSEGRYILRGYQAKHILSITHSFGGFLHIGGGKHISVDILAHVR